MSDGLGASIRSVPVYDWDPRVDILNSPRRDRISGLSTTYRSRVIWLIPFLIVFPDEFAPVIFDVRVSYLKIYLAIFFMPSLIDCFRLRHTTSMLLYHAFMIWFILMVFRNIGVVRAGMFIFYYTFMYVVIIASVRSVHDIYHFIRVSLGFIFVMMCLAIISSVTRTHFLMDWVEAISGQANPFNFREYRLGMIRVGLTTQFIIYGMYCAWALSFAWYTARTTGAALTRAAVIFIATFLSLSSGPILAFLTQVLLIGMEYFSRRIPNRGPIMIGAGLLGALALQFGTSHGIAGFLAHYVLIDAKSFWYRRLIWERVGDDIARNPIFGMNPANWSRGRGMSPSIDAEWLLIPLTAGYPALILIIAASVLALREIYRHRNAEVGPDVARLRRAWCFTMLALWGGMLTVAYFSYMRPHYQLLMGLGAVLIRLGHEAAAKTSALPSGAAATPTRSGRDAAPRPWSGPVLGNLRDAMEQRP